MDSPGFKLSKPRLELMIAATLSLLWRFWLAHLLTKFKEFHGIQVLIIIIIIIIIIICGCKLRFCNIIIFPGEYMKAHYPPPLLLGL